jgi:prophage antirepressor-like protein
MSENKLAVFTNPDFGEVRTLEINGEPWFVLADVCKALELSNPTIVANRIDEDERAKFDLGRQGNTTIINESGLYSVILRSDKPQAKPFRKWVTSEVLPSIRKTGAYTVNTNAEQWSRQLDVEEKKADAMLLEAKAKQASILLEFTKLNLSPEANQALVACASELMTGVKSLPLPEVEKTYSAGEVGEMFGVSGNKIGRVANAKGLKTEKYGIFVLDKARGHNKQVQTFRYNQTAVDFFRDYFGGDE